MFLHDPDGVAGVLNGVFCLRLDDNRGSGNSFGLGCAGHDLRLDKLVVRGASGDDEPGSHAAVILADAFGNSGEHGRRRVAVTICRVAEDDDCVEMREIRIGFWLNLAGDESPAEERRANGPQHNDGTAAPAEPVLLRGCMAMPGSARRLLLPQWSGRSNGRQIQLLHSTLKLSGAAFTLPCGRAPLGWLPSYQGWAYRQASFAGTPHASRMISLSGLRLRGDVSIWMSFSLGKAEGSPW
jgi:hypothetical protein